VSKVLRKSKEMTVTDGLERSMFVMMLSREIIAAHGEPVRRNANWLEKDRVEGGIIELDRGILVRDSVMEMGWKSACCLGGSDLGMGCDSYNNDEDTADNETQY